MDLKNNNNINTNNNCPYCNTSTPQLPSCKPCNKIWYNFWSKVRDSFESSDLLAAPIEFLPTTLKYCKKVLQNYYENISNVDDDENDDDQALHQFSVICKIIMIADQITSVDGNSYPSSIPNELNEDFFRLEIYQNVYLCNEIRGAEYFKKMIEKIRSTSSSEPTTSVEKCVEKTKVEILPKSPSQTSLVSPIQFRLLNLLSLIKNQYLISGNDSVISEKNNLLSLIKDDNRNFRYWRFNLDIWVPDPNISRSLSTVNVEANYSIENDLSFNQQFKIFTIMCSHSIDHVQAFCQTSRWFSRTISSQGIDLMNERGTHRRSLMFLIQDFLNASILRSPQIKFDSKTDVFAGKASNNLKYHVNKQECELISFDHLNILHHISRYQIINEMIFRKLVFGVGTKKDHPNFEKLGFLDAKNASDNFNFDVSSEKLEFLCQDTDPKKKKIKMACVEKLMQKSLVFMKKWFQINYLTSYDKKLKRFYVNPKYHFDLEDITLQCNLVYGPDETKVFIKKLITLVEKIDNLPNYQYHIFTYAMMQKLWQEGWAMYEEFKVAMNLHLIEIDKETYEINQKFMEKFIDLMTCFYESYGVNGLADELIGFMDEVIGRNVFFVAADSGVSKSIL